MIFIHTVSAFLIDIQSEKQIQKSETIHGMY